MTMYPTTPWPPYVGLVANMKSNPYHRFRLEAGLQPSQAARIVARVRHQVKLPLVVEIAVRDNKSRLARLARAAAAAGANAILLTADDFASAQAAVAELYTTTTLPLFVRCPIASSNERRELHALGAAHVIPVKASESVLIATN